MLILPKLKSKLYIINNLSKFSGFKLNKKAMKTITIDQINRVINIRAKQGSEFNAWLLNIAKQSGISIITLYNRFKH